MPLAPGLFFYCFSFVVIWFGAGLIIKSVDRIAHRLRLSSFALSFFVLGLLTSIPEMAVGANAVLTHKPEIFVGTLLGGTAVIFLCIIPILAILGKGIKLNHDLSARSLVGLLIMLALPGFVVIDHSVTIIEGLILVISYLFVFFVIEKKGGVFETHHTKPLEIKTYTYFDVLKVMCGTGMVFVSSQYIVSQTLVYAELLHISAFYISLIILSLGTNLPELSLAVRSIASGKKDIAFGDYLGSAAANTLLFGIFTLANKGEIFAFNSFLVTFLFIAVGLVLFYFFSQSKRDISRKEGIVLLSVYIFFIGYELCKGLVLLK